MKNREKFLLTFMITVIMFTVLIIIDGNLELNAWSKKYENFLQEIEQVEKDGKYSLEIEEGIKKYMSDDLEITERERALAFYKLVMMYENMTDYVTIHSYLWMIINFIAQSLTITLFIYCMLTIEYKNKKQYVSANIVVFGLLLIVQFINNILGLADSIIFIYSYRTSEIFYLVFLIGNAIKNKRKIQMFNIIVLILLNLIYSEILDYFVNCDFIYAIYSLLLAIEWIIVLIKNKANKTQINEETNKLKIQE